MRKSSFVCYIEFLQLYLLENYRGVAKENQTLYIVTVMFFSIYMQVHVPYIRNRSKGERERERERNVHVHMYINSFSW